MEELLKGSFSIRINGWRIVKLSGGPETIGYQHGYIAAEDIKDALERFKLYCERTFNRSWGFFRDAARDLYLPKLPEFISEELKGMERGLKDRGIDIDLIDLVAMNGIFDSTSYHYWLRIEEGRKPEGGLGHCSAMIACGEATTDGGVILAHNTWFPYMLAVKYNQITMLEPEEGNKVVMQSCPGFVMSGMDWYLNSAGIVAAETTITGITTFNQDGEPYFSRIRRAIQFSSDIDGFVSTMLKDNNGGYADGWLIGDIKKGEIAYLELATYNHSLKRSESGWFFGSNIAIDEKVKEEVEFDFSNRLSPPVARNERWKQIVDECYGYLDIELAKAIMADHVDPYTDEESYQGYTICGHVESDPRGWVEWEAPPYYPFGCFDSKVTSASLAERMAFWAKWGKPCGRDFLADRYLERHKEYEWQRGYLVDIISHPWTLIEP